MKSTGVAIALIAFVVVNLTFAKAEARFEPMIPPHVPETFKTLARHIDQAEVMTVRNFKGCAAVLTALTNDLGLIAVGHILNSNTAAVKSFAATSLSVSRAVGGCLMQDSLSAPDQYVLKMLELSGKNLVRLTIDLGY